MTLVENINGIKTSILANLRAAAKQSEIHQGIQLELNAIEEGENPHHIIGKHWGDMVMMKWHEKDSSELVGFFNQLAHG